MNESLNIYQTPILLKGYNPRQNPEKIYKTAKAPIGTSTGFTKAEYKVPTADEIQNWIANDGWIGHLVPEGRHIIDAEDPHKISLIREINRKNRITPPVNVTNNGLQFIYSTNGGPALPGADKRITRAGFPVTDRAALKNYVILPPTNGRTWENEDQLDNPPVIPDELLPAQNTVADTLNALAWALGDAHREGLLAGYDDLDGGFMALLMSCNISEAQILAAYQLAFLNDYDERRTLAMYQRTKDRTEKEQPLNGIGSLVQSLKDKGRDDIAGLVTKLERLAGRLPNGKSVNEKPLQLIDAGLWAMEELPAPEQVLEGIFDIGDKLAIIAPSKSMKSFFALQMAISIAVGLPFLGWKIQKPYKVCFVQLEIKAAHFQKRLKNICRGLEIAPKYLEDRLKIINARGLGLTGTAGVEKIKQAIADWRPEMTFIDPLYKIATGDENAAKDAKTIYNAFDTLAEESSAAIAYTHHDSKGAAGDRSVIDRGSGSGVLARDYDAAIVLTGHASDLDSIVVETVLRNYRPQEPFTIQFVEDEERRGYRFEERPDIMPTKKTSKTKPAPPALSIYLPIAESILKNEEMEMGAFKAAFKMQAGLSDKRIREFLTWATAGGNPHILEREKRGKGTHKKWIWVNNEK
jgi:hypothetical protein